MTAGTLVSAPLFRSVRSAQTGSDVMRQAEMQEIEIEGDMIRLGQLLKLSALAESGADARQLLLASVVTVNGVREARRGRQLHRGDVVAVGEQAVRVV